MTKITLTDLVNLQNETTAVNAINSNNAVVETAFDNTLSRDGTAPNQMLSVLDMNSNGIINLPPPTQSTSPLRLQDITSLTTTGLITIANNTVAGNFSGGPSVPVGIAVTGTGNVAMSASPTFTGVPAAPTASPGTNTTQLATTAFVSNAVAGSSSPTITPQGRLTLLSGIPVMQTNQANANTVIFTPYGGNYIPIYNGSVYITSTFTELAQLTTDTLKSPAAVVANSLYDVFVWNDSGTLRATRGPAWTSGTARGTGAGTTELQLVGGLWLNKNSISNGPAANRGTYVGTFKSNSSSLVDFIFGSIGIGGVAGVFNVWNAYNRVLTGCTVIDNTNTYTYNSQTIRQKNNSAGNQVSYVVGLAEDAVQATTQDFVTMVAGPANFALNGLGLDSITVYSAEGVCINTSGGSSNVFGTPWTSKTFYPGIGTHYVAALESSATGFANVFSSQGTNCVNGLNFLFPM